LAGIAMFPLSFESTFSDVVMVVSISLADTVSSPLLISNKKQSRMGIVLDVFNTPLIDLRCLRSVDAEITKFISRFYFSEITVTRRNSIPQGVEF